MTPLLTDLPRWSVFGWFLQEGKLYKVHQVDQKEKSKVVDRDVLTRPVREAREHMLLEKSKITLRTPPTRCLDGQSAVAGMAGGAPQQEKRGHGFTRKRSQHDPRVVHGKPPERSFSEKEESISRQVILSNNTLPEAESSAPTSSTKKKHKKSRSKLSETGKQL